MSNGGCALRVMYIHETIPLTIGRQDMMHSVALPWIDFSELIPKLSILEFSILRFYDGPQYTCCTDCRVLGPLEVVDSCGIIAGIQGQHAYVRKANLQLARKVNCHSVDCRLGCIISLYCVRLNTLKGHDSIRCSSFGMQDEKGLTST